MNRHFSERDIQTAKKHIKRCSISLIIVKMEIKTTMRYYFISVSIPLLKKKKKKRSVGKYVEKLEPLCTAVRM